MAVEQEDTAGQYMIGLMYLQGKGVSQDYSEAEKYIRMAAERGETAAQYLLGTIYNEGLGVTKDFIQSYTWLTLAIAESTNKQNSFFKKSTDLRNSLTGKMTSPQTSEAKRLIESLNTGPFIIGSEAEMPVILKQSRPLYTQAARDARVEGIITLQAIVRKNGSLDNIKLIKNLGYGLDESVINTLKSQWLFKPALYKGYPVEYMVDIEIAFSIH